MVSIFVCFRGKLVFTLTQVLEHSSDDPRFGNEIACIAEVYLLEETWLLASLNPHPNPQLLVFNTLLPPQDPRSWRVLELIRIHPYECYSFPPQCGDLPTTDFPEFSVDLAQKTFLLSLANHKRSAFVVPVESFIRNMCSAHSDPHMEWNDWGRDAIQVHLHPNTLSLQLAGTKLLVLHTCSSDPGGLVIEACDLSKSGQRELQLQRVSGGQEGEYRKVLSTSKLARHQIEGLPVSMYFLENKLIGLYVSPANVQTRWCHSQPHASQGRGDGYYLRVLKIG